MSGSSGGSSGAVSYPAYMQTTHTAWLANIDVLIAAASNPFIGAVAYDPDTDLANTAAQLLIYSNLTAALDPEDDWETSWTTVQNKLEQDVFSDGAIDEKVAAYATAILARLNQDVLPKYQRGMQDVRAVMTSAFTIGESLLTADAQRDIDKFEADLKRENEKSKHTVITHAVDSIITSLNNKITANQNLVAATVESNRIRMVAKQEENQRNIAYDEKEELWDFELYVFAGNLLASISGAASTTTGKEVSTAQSVLGGAMSGASAGAMIGGPIGAGIGGVVGGLAGLL